MAKTDPQSTAFLTAEEAARRLGISRLRVREAAARGLLKSRRDNEGRLRVDLPDDLTLGDESREDLAPDAMIGFLFDDIEELEGQLGDESGKLERAFALLEKQDAALGQMHEALSASEARNGQLAALIERSLAALEASGQVETVPEGSAEVTSGFADKAMTLLEESVAKAEDAQGHAVRASEDATAARAEAHATAKKLSARENDLDATLKLGERATALVEAVTETGPVPRKGFWRRLFGV